MTNLNRKNVNVEKFKSVKYSTVYVGQENMNFNFPTPVVAKLCEK